MRTVQRDLDLRRQLPLPLHTTTLLSLEIKKTPQKLIPVGPTLVSHLIVSC